MSKKKIPLSRRRNTTLIKLLSKQRYTLVWMEVNLLIERYLGEQLRDKVVTDEDINEGVKKIRARIREVRRVCVRIEAEILRRLNEWTAMHGPVKMEKFYVRDDGGMTG